MTNEFAIKVLTELKGYGDKFANIGFDRKEALNMAIKALEQPSVTDFSDKCKECGKILNDKLQARWIPVSERFPAFDEDVLVTNGKMYIGWVDPTDRGWRVDSESEYFMDDILAWMPLPEPYKAESEGEE